MSPDPNIAENGADLRIWKLIRVDGTISEKKRTDYSAGFSATKDELAYRRCIEK
jgi:hypothetical protein